MTIPRSILCTICARGGSKGVKNKNLRELNGKPLIAHSILHAKETGLFDHIAVSSDSPEILAAAKAWGADIQVRRPDELATDTADKLSAIRNAVELTESITGRRYETLVDLDATSPLRLPADIVSSVELFFESKALNLITAAPARRSPYFNMVERDETGFVKISKPLPARIVRRQDSPECYDMNASIYVWTRECLLTMSKVFTDRTALYVMPEERSHDIDTELDFEIVEMILKKRAAT